MAAAGASAACIEIVRGRAADDPTGHGRTKTIAGIVVETGEMIDVMADVPMTAAMTATGMTDDTTAKGRAGEVMEHMISIARVAEREGVSPKRIGGEEMPVFLNPRRCFSSLGLFLVFVIPIHLLSSSYHTINKKQERLGYAVEVCSILVVEEEDWFARFVSGLLLFSCSLLFFLSISFCSVFSSRHHVCIVALRLYVSGKAIYVGDLARG
ncbi:hypothetical protein BCR34DRAFT_99683 [Clohesyomyces aquaticus]|uniref:Uncharacterized protein n=1 Tax=Clohesyomyces aquaticus TaxID=1231657 RepID=A0A1Y1YTF3_9PLEO|nr:hypothetical protein BCR34DRAFT_99683 [Clohesyomyces aquaticus]